MDFLRKLYCSVLSAGLLAFLSPSWGASASVDSLRLSAFSARWVASRSKVACAKGLSESDLLAQAKPSLQSSNLLELDASSANLLRLRIDDLDGLCGLTLDYQDQVGHASARATLAPGQTLAQSKILDQLTSQIAQSLVKERGAGLDLRTTPPGAQVWLSGVAVGVTPLRIDGLRPGTVQLRVGLADWKDSTEMLTLRSGQILSLDRSLVRSAAWRDSVKRASLALHRDSIAKLALSHPAQDLAELFDRLAQPVKAGSHWTVAILPFEVRGTKPRGYDPGVMVAEYGLARWSGDGRFALIERTGVNRLLKEQAFAQSGAVSDSGAAKLGKLVAARYLVTGTVLVGKDKQVFTARLVSVETGELIAAATAEKTNKDVEAIYREALGEKGQVGAALYRSLVGPGWGQFYTGHPVQGTLALGAAMASIGFAAWAWNDFSNKDDLVQRYRHYDPALAVPDNVGGNVLIQNAEAARGDRNEAANTFVLSLGVVGAVWAVNLIDAGILGQLESGRIRSKYYALLPTPELRPEGLALAWRF